MRENNKKISQNLIFLQIDKYLVKKVSYQVNNQK